MNKEQLHERQNRVYGVLDVATKPAQWLIGGVQLVILLFIVADVCIVVPIYYFLHGGTFSSFQFAVGCWILGFLVMLFGAPWYTSFWGAVIFCSLFWWDINKSDASGNVFLAVLWLYEGVGLLWVAVKVITWLQKRRSNRTRNCEIYSATLAPAPQPKAVAGLQVDTSVRSTDWDAPLPEELRVEVQHALDSICDELESAFAADNPLSEASDASVDSMPLNDAIRSTVEWFAAVSNQMGVLVQKAEAKAFASPEEAGQAIRSFFAMQEKTCSRMESMIARIKRELPTFSVTELEDMLAIVKQQRAELSQFALRAGFVQSR